MPQTRFFTAGYVIVISANIVLYCTGTHFLSIDLLQLLLKMDV